MKDMIDLSRTVVMNPYLRRDHRDEDIEHVGNLLSGKIPFTMIREVQQNIDDISAA